MARGGIEFLREGEGYLIGIGWAVQDTGGVGEIWFIIELKGVGEGRWLECARSIGYTLIAQQSSEREWKSGCTRICRQPAVDVSREMLELGGWVWLMR